MYLENSEQREGELSAEVFLAEQCAIPKLTEAAGLSSPLSQSAELGIKVLVEYTEQTVREEMEPALLFVEPGKLNLNLAETCTFCVRHAESAEQQSASHGFFDSVQILDDCNSAGLSRPFVKCAQHCECFKPCESSEYCANHSLASERSLCCEHCPEQLQLFPQCKSTDESSDCEPEELEVDFSGLGQCGMSCFIPKCVDHLQLQQYERLGEQCDSSDSEEDTSSNGPSSLTQFISGSVNSLDGAASLCEYDEAQAQPEYTDEDYDVDEDDESYEAEPNETEFSDEEDTPALIDLEENVDFEDDFGESIPYAEENSQASTSDIAENVDDCEDEAAEPCNSENGAEFCAEEDGFSECSSVESKSFKTCLDDSFPSDPFSDSSEESDKGAQEDSSDEQMQWESFEGDEEEAQQSDLNQSTEEKKNPPPVDVVIEHYFDLFDREDCHGHMFAQKRSYISCFDGGDIHDHLFLEEETQKRNTKTVHKLGDGNEEANTQETDPCSKDAPEISDEEDLSQEEECCDSKGPPDDCSVKSESCSTGDEEEFLAFYPGSSDDAEDDGADYSFDVNICDDYDEEPELVPYSSEEERVFPPSAREMSVEDDAYEDEVSMNNESLGEVASSGEETDKNAGCEENDKDEPELSHFLSCSEKEPYWALIDSQESDGYCEPGVEDYYAYEIKSSQSSGKRALNQFILGGDSKLSPFSGRTYDLSSLREATGQTAESEEESDSKETSKDLKPPVDVIHSVVSKHANDGTQSRDSEEEQSDDESLELCECEYCIPKAAQVPAEPLLSEMKTQDAGKICVVIDLDETLVHSSFKPLNNADFIIPVEIEGTLHQVYVLKRPHVDEFLQRMGELFECVLFTASLSKYADPVSDLLDKWGAFRSRLFREACVFHKGNYVKDLSRLGRDLNKVLIIDNSPASYIFHPENAVPVVSWFDDMSDTELLDLIPFFERLSKEDDIYDGLQKHKTSS
ncbi:uncharacterized protein ACNS7B_024580 [Menidia menidia]